MANVLMVVVSYNSTEKTKQTIQNLMHQTEYVDIGVWDNASTDGTSVMLMRFKNIGIVFSKTNELWSPAVNKAIEAFYDGQEYIGFMNNDILLERECISKMIDTAKREEVGLVAPVGAGLGGLQDYVVHVKDKENIQPEVRGTYVVGACCLMRKKVWDEIGPLDERMPLGADDHDYCIRLKHRGYGIYIRQDTYANHATHSSAETLEGQKNWKDWGGESWKAFNTKWDGYYATEEEAIKAHWGGTYDPAFVKGTGWSEAKYQDRVELGKY